MTLIDPLTPFPTWGYPAPYHTADLPDRWTFREPTRVVAVRCKIGVCE